MDERIENQEIYCHACGMYVQFPIDLSLNGNHVLNCPNCDHEHCRVVKDGVITDERWDRRNGMTFQINPRVITYTTASTSNSSSDGWLFMSSTGTSAVSSGDVYIWTTGS